VSSTSPSPSIQTLAEKHLRERERERCVCFLLLLGSLFCLSLQESDEEFLLNEGDPPTLDPLSLAHSLSHSHTRVFLPLNSRSHLPPSVHLIFLTLLHPSVARPQERHLFLLGSEKIRGANRGLSFSDVAIPCRVSDQISTQITKPEFTLFCGFCLVECNTETAFKQDTGSHKSERFTRGNISPKNVGCLLHTKPVLCNTEI